MADLTILHAVDTAASTSSTSVWTDSAAIASGWIAGHDYIIRAFGAFNDTSSSNEGAVRLVRGTTPTQFDDALHQQELVGTVMKSSFGFLYRYTQPDPVETIKLQIKSNGSNTITIDYAVILAYDVTGLTEDVDFRWNEVTADYTTTSSMVAQATKTFTPNGTDTYAAWAFGVFDVDSITQNHMLELHDSVVGILARRYIEGEDATNDFESGLLMAAFVPSNASHTISARFGHESTDTANVLRSAVFVLKLNIFAQFGVHRVTGDLAPAASPTWTNSNTLSPTPTNTGNWVIEAYADFDVNSQASSSSPVDDVGIRLQVNASGSGLASNPNYGDDAPKTEGQDADNITAFGIGTLVSLTSGAARDINLDATAFIGNTSRLANRTLIAHSVALAAGAAEGQPTMRRWEGIPGMNFTNRQRGHF